MAHYTLFTDDDYELTSTWNKRGVHINIRNSDWFNNPTENLTITLSPLDISVLIEELQMFADAAQEEMEKQNNPSKSEKEDMLADTLNQIIKNKTK